MDVDRSVMKPGFMDVNLMCPLYAVKIKRTITKASAVAYPPRRDSYGGTGEISKTRKKELSIISELYTVISPSTPVVKISLYNRSLRTSEKALMIDYQYS
jgi:hypothetical protein